MLIMLLVTVALVAAYLRIVVRGFDESSGEPRAASRSSRAGGTTGQSVPAGTRPESLEGVLVAQLGSGEITRGQYLQAMERLAARDAERHPLVVPPDGGPPEAGTRT